MTNWAKNFTGLLFYGYDGIHLVRRLVFDNYQTCTLPLKLGAQKMPRHPPLAHTNMVADHTKHFRMERLTELITADVHITSNPQCRPSYHLKTLDTIVNCQRPVFSLGVSHHLRKKTSLWKFELNWASKLRDNNEKKNTLVTQSFGV